MRASLILISGIIVLSLAVARALSCVCSPLECDVLTEEDCPGGLTWDPCRCCKVCARVEGEPCGGLFGFSGSCAVGLQCVIKNLRPLDELDEGTCSKIPGRWRRHCPHGPKMSGHGCNLIGEGTSSETSDKSQSNGRCECGPSVPWCPGEAYPYTFKTRHECKLNLAAKIEYDKLLGSSDYHPLDGAQSITCPEDSIATESGECKCLSPCPPNKCKQGERPVELRAASPNIPGSCCPIYDCVPSEPVSWDDTDDSNLIKNCIDHNGIPRTIGEHWDQNPCVNCSCEESNGKATVSCHATMCKSCERPAALQPGQCCPNCLELTNDTNTITIDDTTTAQVPISECASLDNCDLPCHLGPEDDNGCPICQCPDLESTTRQPTDPTDKICPELPHCGLNCVLVKDQGGCPVCACEDSIESDVSVVQANVQPNEVGDDGRIVCPELKCDLHCERGLVMDDNDCTVCQCKPNNSWCPGIISGCKRICPQGYKINKRGCLTCRCRTTCTDHRNETHPEGTSWQPDECTSCTCDQFGRLICKETVCSVACTNPLPPKPGTCCPVCPISENASSDHHVSRSWGIIPITLIAILTLLVIILMMYVVRGRFRGRLSPSSTTYATYPAQYYKCVPSYETPVHRSEKVVPL